MDGARGGIKNQQENREMLFSVSAVNRKKKKKKFKVIKTKKNSIGKKKINEIKMKKNSKVLIKHLQALTT